MLRCALLASALAACAADDLLVRTPMVMTHDSATGYLKKSGVIKRLVYDWAATQNVDFYGQMQCGARGFDLRAKVKKDGSVVMHHDKIDVDTPLETALNDVKRFLAENPDELAVLISSHCFTDAGDCNAAVRKVAEGVGAHFIDTCRELATLTYEGAKVAGRLPTGGAMLVVRECSNENWDASISCYNKKSVAEGFGPACYGWSSFHDGAFNRMYAYLNRTSAALPNGRFSQLQALWQEDAAGVAEGTLLGSSLIDDEKKSDLNHEVLMRIQEGWFPRISFLEVNNVCNHGEDLRQALKARWQ